MTEIAEDADLTPAEKELNIRVNKEEQTLHVHSEIGSVTRALLNRSDFEEHSRRTADETVVAVTGVLPMGVLKVQKNEREYGSFSNIVGETDE